MWLLEGYSIQEISRFLGHSNIGMTEKCYVKTSAVTADRGMQRVRGIATERQHNSFLHTYKAS